MRHDTKENETGEDNELPTAYCVGSIILYATGFWAWENHHPVVAAILIIIATFSFYKFFKVSYRKLQ